MATSGYPRPMLRETRSSSHASVSSLESIAFPSSKPTTPTARDKYLSTFTLLPPPSQRSSKSKRPRPSPRPSQQQSSASSLPASASAPAPPSSPHSPQRRLPSARVAAALAATPWPLLDPDNAFLLSSSRLFQISHLELGEVTRQQNSGKEPKYGESKVDRNPARKRKARKVLDQLERQRLDALGGDSVRRDDRTVRIAQLGPGDDLETSWAKTRDGVEWEDLLLRKLSRRLSRQPNGIRTGEDFIPLVSANDLERNVRKTTLGPLDCWILGREFPCRKVVLTGWILDREWRESGDQKRWIYTLDDGTALVQVICPVDDAASSSHRPESRSAMRPVLEPQLRIPKYCLPKPSSASDSTRADSTTLSYSIVESNSTSNETAFPAQSLVRVVGSITVPDFYQTELRITADRIEAVSVQHELEHHSTVNKLWDKVYSQPVDVRGMLERVEREEKEFKRERDRSMTTSTAGSDYASGDVSSSGSSCSVASPGSKFRYRPTRPSKLCSQDVTLTNFVVYIRHHLVKRHVVSTAVPPPSSQGSLSADLDDDEPVQNVEHCVPFSIDQLRENKHLELFARRLSLEKDRKERERTNEQRKRRRRDGDLSLLDATNSRGDDGEEGVWIAQRRDMEGRPTKESRNRVVTGTAKLVNLMLPPPRATAQTSSSSESHPCRTGSYDDEDEDEPAAKEIGGRKLEKAIKRCWEEAIRLMTKNGMIVEYVRAVDGPASSDDEQEEICLGQTTGPRHGYDCDEVLPDEPRHVARQQPRTPRRSGTTDVSSFPIDDTPRASSKLGRTAGSRRLKVPRQRFQLVTPVSLAPLVLEIVRDLSSAASFASSRPSITEVEVRLVLYRDDRWSAVAKYGEVVTKTLEVLDKWGEIVPKGEGYRLA